MTQPLVAAPLIDVQNAERLGSFTDRRGTKCDIVRLNGRHIEQVMGLHNTVIAALPPEQSDSLLVRKPDYFDYHLQAPPDNGNCIIGIVREGRLVAKAVIHHPEDEKHDDGDEPYADTLLPHLSLSQVSIVQAVSVHPHYEGLGFMTHLLNSWVRHAEKHGRKQLMARVKCVNDLSKKAFVRAGLRIENQVSDQKGILVMDMQCPTEQAVVLQDSFAAAGGVTSKAPVRQRPAVPSDYGHYNYI